ncbi:MAG TPA: diguanylate cyclase [Acidimicrobiales bacterium]|nr:diguanylate cyclase [Acidimicrobiales bacterium]
MSEAKGDRPPVFHHRLARATAGLTLAGGLAHLIALALGGPDDDAATLGTGLSALAVSIAAIGILVHRPGDRRRGVLTALAGLVVVATSLAVLVVSLTTGEGSLPGPVAAMVLAAIGYGVATLPQRGHHAHRACGVLAAGTSTVVGVELLAHLYAATSLTRSWWAGIPLPVAVTAGLLCVAVAVSRPDRPPLRWLHSSAVDSSVLVRLVPVVVLVPVVHRVGFAAAEAAGARHALAHTAAMVAVTVAVAVPVAVTARATARAEAQLRTERARLDAVVTALDEGLVVRDQAGHVVLANPRSQAVTGLDYLTDPPIAQIAAEPRFIDADGHPLPFEEMGTGHVIATGEPVIGQVIGVRRPDRPDRWLRVSAVPVGERGDLGVATTMADITAEREAIAALAASEEQFRLTFATAAVGMAIVGLDGRFLDVNDAMTTVLGRGRDELLGIDFQSITHPDDLDTDLHLMRSLLSGERSSYSLEKRYQRPDGTYFWGLLHGALARDPDGLPRHFVGQIVDLSARKAAEAALTHAATHDPLTGLPNRRLLQDRLAIALADRGRRAGRVGVLFCDLDDFKVVNDRHGHEVGDQVLVSLADRIHQCLRAGDTVGRMGGDEFLVVAAGLADGAELVALGRRIIDAVGAPISVGRTEVRMGVSVGGRLAEPADDPAGLLRLADRAMYDAKRSGRALSVTGIELAAE